MTELFNELVAVLQEMAKDPSNNIFLYGILFLSAVVENLFPPIPGDTITAFGAFLVGAGILDYGYVYLATTMGSVIGFMALYFVGRALKREFFIRKNYKAFSAESIVKAETWFSRWGYYIVLANRFMPGIRSVISIVSGISRLNYIYVTLLALVSASIWNLIWIHTGYVIGGNWEYFKDRMADILRNYNIAVGSIMFGAVIIYFTVKYFRQKNS